MGVTMYKITWGEFTIIPSMKHCNVQIDNSITLQPFCAFLNDSCEALPNIHIPKSGML
jgi:hypothetical protein